MRKAKQYDTTAYTNLGAYHWKEISEGINYDAGKANIKPKVQYLHPDGYEETFYDHIKQTVMVVKYDEEYVLDHYYSKIVKGFNWENRDGTIREDILKRFLDRFYDYCCSHTEAQKQRQLEQQIKTLMAATGKTEDEIKAWMEGKDKEANTASLEPLQEVLNVWETKIHESMQKSSTGQPSERYKFTAQMLEELKQVIN
ncbi:hypothetical protein WDZ92_08655 [Nostoc sp. NIES-2111]